MSARAYETDVFINCPFDEAYQPLLEAVLFAIIICGFRPRCALEIHDSGSTRIDKIVEIIRGCRLGVHDISRTELDPLNRLPRFNMPFELGLFLGAHRFGTGQQRKERCLILDVERYRYQKFLSDISGQDPSDYDQSQPDTLIKRIRDWLKTHTDQPLPGATEVQSRFSRFQMDKPTICQRLQLAEADLTYADVLTVIDQWVSEPEPTPRR